MRTAIGLCGLLTCGLLWAQPSEPTELRVRVQNAAGQPLTNARVGALAVDFRRLQVMPATEPLMQPVDAQGAARLQWHPAHQATVQEILAGERGGAVVLLVSAPDHVPLCRALTYPIAAEQTVALRTGQTMQLRLKPALSPPDDFGTRLPFQKPLAWEEVFYTPFGSDLFVAPLESLADREGLDIPSLQVLNALTRLYLFPGFGIERVSATEYRLTLPPQMDGTAWLWVNRPDWLVGYATEIRPDEVASGAVERMLPASAMLEVRMDLQGANLQGQDGSLMLYRQAGGMYVACARAPLESPKQEIVFRDLAPGEGWTAMAMYMPREYSERGGLRRSASAPALVSGELRAVAIRPTAPADTAPKGNRTVTVRLLQADGTPLSNARVQVFVYDEQSAVYAPVARGQLDANGAITLRDLAENPPDKPARECVQYYLQRDTGSYSEPFRFILRQGDGIREVVFRPPLSAGDRAPDFELQETATGKPRRLSEFRGKWVLLDFWATWCGPCHKAMEKLRAFLTKHGATLGERAQIIAISLDESRAPAQQMVQARGWDALALHLWAGADAFDSRIAQAFGIRGIPSYVLISPDGKVAHNEAQEFTAPEEMFELLLLLAGEETQ
jgi:peroxiredoxin